MRRILWALLTALTLITLSQLAVAGGYRSYGSSPYHSRSYSSHTRSYSHGRIYRSAAAKNEFKREHPCPSTGRSSGSYPGYVIDHVNPLACGGAAAPSNMQWQTTTDAKAKDKTERIGCR